MVGFAVLAVLLVAGGVGVVTLRQPVHAALALVGTLLALAVTYVTLQAHFLAAVQVIVYAGAIMVLFLFVIMLLNVGGERLGDRLAWLRPAAWVAAAVAAVAVVAVAVISARPLPAADVVTTTLAGGNAGSIAEVLFTDYLLAFQLVGVLLLTGVVAAVGLVQRAAPETRPQERSLAGRGAPHEPYLGVGGEGAPVSEAAGGGR
ncbi:MAG: NADH-quinone oxidoreductase subunit J [Trueperaceae bacterium]|nr:NADH-quinone oxidoreductase subunit J [Trueperaceae bacterium]